MCWPLNGPSCDTALCSYACAVCESTVRDRGPERVVIELYRRRTRVVRVCDVHLKSWGGC
eukprot:4370588-Prymnesium_polylepis.1